MNTLQVYNFFKNKKDFLSPCADGLIQAGYQQESGGYIKNAKEQGIAVDYQKCQPSQYWHLIESYCSRTEDDVNFTRRIQCGELILWMAETSQAVSKEELDNLVDRIIKSGEPCPRRKGSTKPPVKYSRKIWNREIQNVCFDKIVQKVEAASEY